MPTTFKLHEITYEETEQLSTKITRFVVDKIKFLPFLHLNTLSNRDVISLADYQKMNDLLFRFEINLYLKVSDLLFKAFRSCKAGIEFSLSAEENMNLILHLLSENHLIEFPIGGETWKIRVEFRPHERAFVFSEFSHGRLDYERVLSVKEAFSPLSSSGRLLP